MELRVGQEVIGSAVAGQNESYTGQVIGVGGSNPTGRTARNATILRHGIGLTWTVTQKPDGTWGSNGIKGELKIKGDCAMDLKERFVLSLTGTSEEFSESRSD